MTPNITNQTQQSRVTHKVILHAIRRKLLTLEMVILKKILSNRTIPVVVPKMNPGIDQRIAPILVAPQTLLTPATKEVVADAASGGAWVNRTPRKPIRTGVDGSTPGNIRNSVSAENSLSRFLIGIFATSPTCGLNSGLQVSNKQHYSCPVLVGKTQKLDAIVDGKLPSDLN